MVVSPNVAPDSLHDAGTQENYQADIPVLIVLHAENCFLDFTVDDFQFDYFGLLRAHDAGKREGTVAVVAGSLNRVGAVANEGSEAELHGKEDVAVVESVFHAFIVPGGGAWCQRPDLNQILIIGRLKGSKGGDTDLASLGEECPRLCRYRSLVGLGREPRSRRESRMVSRPVGTSPHRCQALDPLTNTV